MGNRSSKQDVQVRVANKLFSNVIAQAMQQCTSAAQVQQSIGVSGSSWVTVSGNKQTQTYSLTSNCNMSQQQLTQLQAQIANDIHSQGQQNTQALLSAINDMAGGKRSQNMSTNISNVISTTVTAQLIQSISASINQNQSIVVNGSNNVDIHNNVQTQMSKIVLNAVENQVQQTELMQRVQSIATQQTQQNDKNPIADIVGAFGKAGRDIIDGLGDVLGGSGNAKIFLLILACVVVYVLWTKYMGGGNGGGGMAYGQPSVVIVDKD